MSALTTVSQQSIRSAGQGNKAGKRNRRYTDEKGSVPVCRGHDWLGRKL